jgi:hypothetical protein
LLAPPCRCGEVTDRARDQRLRIGLQAPSDRVVDLLGRVWRVEDPAHPPLHEVRVVGAPVGGVELQPALRHRGTDEERTAQPRMGQIRQRRPPSGLTGKNGPMNAAPSTRSGCSAASSSARCSPLESDTSAARSVPVASITAIASAATPPRRMPAAAAVGQTGRFRAARTSGRGSGAQGRGSGPSTRASG